MIVISLRSRPYYYTRQPSYALEVKFVGKIDPFHPQTSHWEHEHHQEVLVCNDIELRKVLLQAPEKLCPQPQTIVGISYSRVNTDENRQRKGYEQEKLIED